MSKQPVFGLWITGIPASGKSTIVKWIVEALGKQDIRPVILESDALRRILTPAPTYDREERDRFYRQMADIGILLVQQGTSVIFDATANRREYRDRARRAIERYAEVFVDCPVDDCRRRDPKGIYAAIACGTAQQVPGIQSAYEPPTSPDLVVDGRQDPQANAAAVIARLRELCFI